MAMEKLFQALKLSVIAALLFITPLLSTSLRPAYLYFIINVLIFTVAMEAGLLSSLFPDPATPAQDPHKPLPPPNANAPKPAAEAINASDQLASPPAAIITDDGSERRGQRPKGVDKSAPEKTNSANGAAAGGVLLRKHKLVIKKCPSMPSIFFIGEAEEVAAGRDHPKEEEESNNNINIEEEVEEEEEEEESGGLSRQELYTKAEAFIGNFYMELKLQREESWKKIHGLYIR